MLININLKINSLSTVFNKIGMFSTCKKYKERAIANEDTKSLKKLEIII